MKKEIDVSSLMQSLSALAAIRLVDLEQRVPVHLFRDAMWRTADGNFEIGPSMDGDGFNLKIAYGNVTVKPKAFIGRPKIPSDCFEFKCYCGERLCEHVVSAWMILHMAATRKFSGLRALGARKVEDFAEFLAFLSTRPHPAAHAGADGEPIRLKALLFCAGTDPGKLTGGHEPDVEKIPPAVPIRHSDRRRRRCCPDRGTAGKVAAGVGENLRLLRFTGCRARSPLPPPLGARKTQTLPGGRRPVAARSTGRCRTYGARGR